MEHVEHACVLRGSDGGWQRQWNARFHRLRGRTGTLGREDGYKGWYRAYQSAAVLRTEHLRKGYLPLKCVFLVTFSLSSNHTGPLWGFYRDKLVGVRKKVRNETLNVEPLIKQPHSYPQNNKYPELCRSIIVSAPHFSQQSNLTQSCRIKKSKPQGCEFFINYFLNQYTKGKNFGP